MKLLLASANLHKHEEFQDYFGTLSDSFSISKAEQSLELEESGDIYRKCLPKAKYRKI